MYLPITKLFMVLSCINCCCWAITTPPPKTMKATKPLAAGAANILCLMGTASPSHHIWNKSIMTALAAAGHNLTILTVEMEPPTRNMHYIHMENVYQSIASHYLSETGEANENTQLTPRSPWHAIVNLYSFYGFVDARLIESEGMRQLLDYPPDFQFDLVIHDFTQAQVLLGFVDRFDYPPLVSVSPLGMPAHTYAVTNGVINWASAVPHMTTNYGSRMSFIERGKNAGYFAFDWFYRTFVFMVNENRKARRFFGGNMPSLQMIEKRTELVLVNVDFSLEYARPLPPNVVAVGGLQVKRPEPVDKELEKFMAEAKNGLIYFSLGSNVQSSMLGQKIQVFLATINALSEYNFIWKYEEEDLMSLPRNLRISKWLPQNSILAHPNCKLFITHGGLLSYQESIWHGVPMLGIPFFVDQHQNVQKFQRRGLGRSVDILNVTAVEMIQNIRAIINTPSYSENAQQRSRLFRDQPMHPLDRAVFWINSVIRHKGLSHLRVDTDHLNFFQLYLIDVMVLLTLLNGSFCLMIVFNCWSRKQQALANNSSHYYYFDERTQRLRND